MFCVGYKKALNVLSFDGPTNFADIIDYVNRMVEYEVVHSKYAALMFTDC